MSAVVVVVSAGVTRFHRCGTYWRSRGSVGEASASRRRGITRTLHIVRLVGGVVCTFGALAEASSG